MGLPNSREALPSGPGSIIPSSTILAIEDCIIGAKHGPISLSIPIMTIPGTATEFPPTNSPSGQRSIIPIGPSAPQALIPFLLPTGKRILRVRARVFDNTAPQSRLQVGLATGTAPAAVALPLTASTVLALSQTVRFFGDLSAGDGTRQMIMSALANTLVDPDALYAVNVASNTGTGIGFITNAYVDFDAP